MPRKGWRAVETPAGWYEVIRGPRPPSVKWPMAQPIQVVPRRGRWRGARTVADSKGATVPSVDEVRQERGWKLFMLLPRMLLHRPPGGGVRSKLKLSREVSGFSSSQPTHCATRRQRVQDKGNVAEGVTTWSAV